MSVEMEYRSLGNTGLKVSALSFGNWITSDTKECATNTKACIKKCFDYGVNFFDTAEAYGAGQAEIIMGEALQELKAPREDLVISTKIFRGFTGGENKIGLSRKRVLEGVNNSLKRLQLDYVDVIFAHRPDPDTPVEETCLAFNQVIEDGKAFYWGTSEWTPDRIMAAHLYCEKKGLIPPIVEQPQYNLLVRENLEVNYTQLFEEFGMGTTVWSPLASGFLTGKYNHGIPAGSRFDADTPVAKLVWNRYMSDDKKDHTMKALQGVEAIAKELGFSQAQFSLAWVLTNRDVSTAIFGASRPEQIDDNIKALEVAKLITPEILDKVDQLLGNKPTPEMNWKNWGPGKTRRDKQRLEKK